MVLTVRALAAFAACLNVAQVHAQCPYMTGELNARDLPAHHPGAERTDDFLKKYEVDDTGATLTSDVGGPFSDQTSLKAGERGSTLLEDFIFRQKIQHFDHERVPERGKQ